MRKELGKPTRDLLFRRLGEIAPEFVRDNRYDTDGATWTLARRDGELRQWLSFQTHRNYDAFTVELGWSCVQGNPYQIPFADPAAELCPAGNRFRLGSLWNAKGDHWWYVGHAREDRDQVPSEDWIEASLAPPAVEDAISCIQQHALPYFASVANWSKAG